MSQQQPSVVMTQYSTDVASHGDIGTASSQTETVTTESLNNLMIATSQTHPQTTEEGTISASSSQTTQTTPAVISNVCKCNCEKVTKNVTVTQSEIDGIVEKLKSELTVESTDLSSSVRKKTSAKDERTSAQVTGSVGVAFLVLIGLIPVILDMDRVIAVVTSVVESWRGESDVSNIPEEMGGDEFMVGGDQFVVGGGEVMVGGDEFMVGGDQFVVGGGEVMVGGDEFVEELE